MFFSRKCRSGLTLGYLLHMLAGGFKASAMAADVLHHQDVILLKAAVHKQQNGN